MSPAAVLAEGLARERASLGGRRSVTPRRRRDDRGLGREGRALRGDPLPAGPRPHAGLHRRPRRRRPRGDARRDGSLGGIQEDQPAGAGRPGHRPLGSGGRVRQRCAPSTSTPTATTSETRSATRSSLGPAGVRRLPRGAAGTGICHQVNLEYLRGRLQPREGRHDAGLPRHAGRHRLHTTMVNGLGVLGWGVAGSRPRRRCSASRSRCSCRRSSAFSWTASCPRARPRPTSS